MLINHFDKLCVMREVIIVKPNSIIKHRGKMKIQVSYNTRLELNIWGTNKDEKKILNKIYDNVKHTLSMNGYKFELCSLSAGAKKYESHQNKERKNARRHGNKMVVISKGDKR